MMYFDRKYYMVSVVASGIVVRNSTYVSEFCLEIDRKISSLLW